MTDVTKTAPTLPPYRGKARHEGQLTKNTPTDSATLQKFCRERGLFMRAERLFLLLKQFKRNSAPLTMETLYLLDGLCALYARRPETQALVGFETDDADRADALSSLIFRLRETAGVPVTPPLMLRAVLDVIREELVQTAPPRPYDTDPARHMTTSDIVGAAALRLGGMLPHAMLYSAQSREALLLHDNVSPSPARTVCVGDRLCLLHGKADRLTAHECNAAAVLFWELHRDKDVRCAHAVEQDMLLPCALSILSGMTVDMTLLPHRDTAPRFPCDLTDGTWEGYLVAVAPDAQARLTALAAAHGLTLAPFATADASSTLCFVGTYNRQPVKVSTALLRELQMSLAYRVTEQREDAVHTLPLEPVPLLHCRDGFDGCGTLADESTLGAWFVRALRICPEQGYDPDVLSRALASLLSSLRDEGGQAADASVACTLQVSPALSRETLWRYVLQLYTALRDAALPCLPITLRHTETAQSSLQITLLCHKPADATAPASVCAPLPLPAACSLVHAQTPQILLVFAPQAGVPDRMAALLTRAGGSVQTLRSLTAVQDGFDSFCTALADAIHASHMVVFVGDGGSLAAALTSRRVQYALQTLVSRDGLCLAHGTAYAAFCRAGLLGEALRGAEFIPAGNLSSAAFPYPLCPTHPVETLSHALRAIPGCVLRLGGDLPAGDPVAQMFRAHDPRAWLPLTVTEDCSGEHCAVRLCAEGGHVLAFADGFDEAELCAAVRYFR